MPGSSQAVEAPALAVMVPLLLRGVKDEQPTPIKRKACVIITNMSKLVSSPVVSGSEGAAEHKESPKPKSQMNPSWSQDAVKIGHLAEAPVVTMCVCCCAYLMHEQTQPDQRTALSS